ncbi:hypothetical protein D4764_0220270 [Takifugu flavidus]|uniref:Uncharacterized protein n=1 Tax=Takifugu flavidus TaxID=433684 RepID=A0A5C6MG55_9TELE|nr:hypothetical protein D4764_0220270 [Takifugu flavidus]
MLHMFYQPVMASTIFCAVVLDNVDEVVRDRMVLKVGTIMDSPPPLHNTVDKLRSSSSSRLLQPRCSKERYRKSFLPAVHYQTV